MNNIFFRSFSKIIRNTYYNIKNNFMILIIVQLCYLYIPMVTEIYTNDLIDMSMKYAKLTEITQENFMKILTSPLSMLFLLAWILIIYIYVLLEIVAVYVILDSSINGERLSIGKLFKKILHNLVKLFNIRNIGIVIFLLLSNILSYVNLGAQFIDKVQIPEFVIDWIYSNEFFSILYTGVKIIATIISFLSLFTFYEMVTNERSILRALKNSCKIIWKNKLRSIIYLGILWIAILIINSISFFVIMSLSYYLNFIFENKAPAESILLNTKASFELYLPVIMRVIQYSFIVGIYCVFKNIKVQKIKNSRSVKNIIKAIVLVPIICLMFGMYIDYNIGFPMNENRTPIIAAHRAGGGIMSPENSLKALKNTVSSGIAKVVEIDVQLTKDNRVVLLHDDDLKRVIGIDLKPEELTLEEIQSYKTKDGFGNFTEEPIPTLDDFIKNSKDIKLMIEIKGPENRRIMLINKVLELIEQNKFENNTIIASMRKEDLKYVKKYNPNLQTCFITAVFYSNYFSLDYIDIYSVEATFASMRLRRLAHLEGKQIYYWTINQSFNIKRILDYKPDGIITDNVYLVQFVISSRLETVPFQNDIINYFINKSA